MRNKQDASGGDNSTVNQAGGDVIVTTTNNYGLSYSDVKELAMDVFRSNFLELGKDVESLINERAGKIITEYLDRIVEENPELIQNTKNPDIRYGIYEAQKNYARFGNEDMASILIDLLVERTKSEEESLVSLVLNEALNIIPRISKRQIDTLTFIFLMRYVSYLPNANVSFMQYYLNVIRPVFSDFQIIGKNSDITHLQYTGCLSISLAEWDFDTVINHMNLADVKSREDMSKLASDNPFYGEIKAIWDKTTMKKCTLTTVGIAIAITNLNKNRTEKFSLENWIND